MKISAFPIVIELEIKVEGEWIIFQSFICKNIYSLRARMMQLKSLYVLTDKDYRIILILQSKVNTFNDKIKGAK
jgi:hypothetical protein